MEFRLKFPADPLDYGPTIETGVTQIQALANGSTINTAEPVSIYIPPGRHTLTSAITLTRHNVTLVVDPAAILIPASDTPAILFDGSQTPETYTKHWGLFMYGVIWGTQTGSGQHGVHLLNAIHGTLFANEIRTLGGDGIRFDGSCFSNYLHFNRIAGCWGWGVNTTGANHASPDTNATTLKGEIQGCSLGGANLRRWIHGSVDLRIENFEGGVPGIKLDGAFNIDIKAYFETPLNTTGDDIVTAATDRTCNNITISSPTWLAQIKDSPAYNINLAANTVSGFYLQGCHAVGVDSRFLLADTGNNNVVLMPTARYEADGVTNNITTDLQVVATEAF